MNISSKNLKGGLYGQLILWCLELLPFLEENNISPNWDIKSEFYGDIIGTHILSNKQENINKLNSFDLLDMKINKKEMFTEFKGDFHKANKLFFDFFSFSKEINDEVEEIILQYNGKKILGLHYRGTDKINTEGGYINVDIFKNIVDDYLENNQIDVIFIFNDEISASISMYNYYKNNYIVKNFNDTESNDLLFNTYNNNSTPNNILYKKTIVDSLVLSRCNVVIKTVSQFSGWAKIFNPNLNIYRASSFKENWFPDFYIPPYDSKNKNIKKMLDKIFVDENKTKKQI